jgi:hypothetical protein
MSGTYYKVLSKEGKACHGGTGKWSLPKLQEDGTYKPGRWMPRIADPIPCERGYHLFERKDVLQWLGDTCYEAEYRGTMVAHEDDDKVAVESARLLRPMPNWDDKTLRLFACRVAEDVLPLFERQCPDDDRPRKAIEVMRRYANGEVTGEERAAARAAAWAAAWAAARDAAWDAARAKYTDWLWEMVE